jgi:hypothetical protein
LEIIRKNYKKKIQKLKHGKNDFLSKLEKLNNTDNAQNDTIKDTPSPKEPQILHPFINRLCSFYG